MIRIFYAFLVLTIFTGCKTHKVNLLDLSGTYQKEFSDQKRGLYHRYTLVLKKDSTFSLQEEIFEAKPKCSGNWEYKEGQIILQCGEPDSVAETLSSSYMNKRKYTLRVINENKIKFENFTLKRM